MLFELVSRFFSKLTLIAADSSAAVVVVLVHGGGGGGGEVPQCSPVTLKAEHEALGFL